MLEEQIIKLTAAVEQLTIAVLKSATAEAKAAEVPKTRKPSPATATPPPAPAPEPELAKSQAVAAPTEQDIRDLAQKFLDRDSADGTEAGLNYLQGLKKEYGCSVSKVPEDKRAEVLAKMKKKFEDLSSV